MVNTSRTSATDVHAHVWLSEVHDLVESHPGFLAFTDLELLRSGLESAAVSEKAFAERRPRLTDVGERLAVMDTSGIGVQVVSVVPTQYHTWTPAALAVEVAQTTNEGVARHCAQEPERLVGLGAVPLQHPEPAVECLEHAVLACGLRGIQIPSHAWDAHTRASVELSDPRLDPLWRRAEELGAVVFLHPWGCTLDERLNRWYLSNSVGQPVEHAVALSHLIFGGVLDRFPRLRLIAAHGGGYLPTVLGRADHAWLHRAEARSCAHLPSAYLECLWFDSLVYAAQDLRNLVAAVGAERVLLGSDYPFDMGVTDPLDRLHAARLSAHQTTRIASANAAELDLIPRSAAERSTS
ncbi:amidohydrolase [Streptomyces sp. 4503]|uniref:Amidohydrolase n=1 Tax=Streptomyces niphimycinicus TaxID=2842201 RepID=A0ABS6CDI4_9ACTN|nr:amidohydrolase [Streptomyces niphimycinicus]